MFARQFSFVLVLLIFSVSIGYGHLIGGIERADTDDDRVVAAADFAMAEKYGKNGLIVVGYKIVMASKQLVNGMKYVVTLEVTKFDDTCTVEEFSVWNRAGPPGWFLTNSNIIDVACGTINIK